MTRTHATIAAALVAIVTAFALVAYAATPAVEEEVFFAKSLADDTNILATSITPPQSVPICTYEVTVTSHGAAATMRRQITDGNSTYTTDANGGNLLLADTEYEFEVNAARSDQDGDTLAYNWQFDFSGVTTGTVTFILSRRRE